MSISPLRGQEPYVLFTGRSQIAGQSCTRVLSIKIKINAKTQNTHPIAPRHLGAYLDLAVP
jgi:hypothetical protein